MRTNLRVGTLALQFSAVSLRCRAERAQQWSTGQAQPESVARTSGFAGLSSEPSQSAPGYEGQVGSKPRFRYHRKKCRMELPVSSSCLTASDHRPGQQDRGRDRRCASHDRQQPGWRGQSRLAIPLAALATALSSMSGSRCGGSGRRIGAAVGRRSICYAVTGIVTAIVILVAADRVPAFNVEPFCRAVAMRAAPVGDKDVCLRQEQEATISSSGSGRSFRRRQILLRAADADWKRSDLHRVAHLL